MKNDSQVKLITPVQQKSVTTVDFYWNGSQTQYSPALF